jgi:hypothetical protein
LKLKKEYYRLREKTQPFEAKERVLPVSLCYVEEKVRMLG